jgi:signal transduction histidine kinase
MRRLVGIVRHDAGPGTGHDGLAPQPGADAIPALVERATAAGQRVDLVVEGRRRHLPPGLDLAVFRVVQEALTNARRHADAALVTVRLRYGERSIEVEVVDDGRGAADPVAGNGLVGMRERVQLYGGTLHVAGAPGRGFTVGAAFPVPADVAVPSP